MSSLLLWIQIPVLVFAAAIVVYLLLLTGLAATRRRTVLPAASTLRRFVFVVPAHDEERVIARAVAGLRSVDYPADLFSVMVVADNCSDHTGAKAARAGAIVLTRCDTERRGKGHALSWAFRNFLDARKDIEAFVVIDADSVVSPNFLLILNAYLEQGAMVLQSSDIVEPDTGSWSSAITRIGFLLCNVVRPLGRSSFGGTAGLRGNGMCFSRSFLEAHPWSAFSVGEDIEFGLSLLVKGVAVTFAREAVVRAIMPRQAKNAVSQRARWEGGRVRLIGEYAGPLLKCFLARRRLAYLDAFLELVTPAFANVAAVAFAFAALDTVLYMGGVTGLGAFAVAWAVILILSVLHVMWGLSIAGADRDLYVALLNVPRYVVWKVAVYLRMVGRWRSDVWVRTTRE